jgi:hypothetical protein
VSHCGLAIYIKKDLKAKKEESWKPKYFTMQNIILKKSSKRHQNPSGYYKSVTNLNFNRSQNILFQKSSYKNRPIIIT